MNLLQSSLPRSTSSMDHPEMVHSSPLDLSLLSHGELDRGSDSPLDLSLKTRKRCADTTRVDDDVIFLAHRTLEKRKCFDKTDDESKRQRYISPGQDISWNGWANNNSRNPNQGGYSEDKYFSDLFHKRSFSYKETERTLHELHPTSTVVSEREYSLNTISAVNPFNSNAMGALPGQHYKQHWGTYAPGVQAYDTTKPGVQAYDTTKPGLQSYDTAKPGLQSYDTTKSGVQSYDTTKPGVQSYDTTKPGLQSYDTSKPGVQSYDNANSRSPYSRASTASTISSPESIYHTRKQSPFFVQSPLPSATVHHHQIQQHYPQKTFPFSSVSAESVACVQTQHSNASTLFNNLSPSCVIPSTSFVSQPFLSPQSQHGFKNFAGSELRAALSSAGRFYQNQVPGRCSVAQNFKPIALPLPHRCSPDSTFLPSKSNFSCASVSFQKTASTYSSPIHNTAVHTLPNPKSRPTATIEELPTRYHIKNPSHEMHGWDKSPTRNVQHVSNSPSCPQNVDDSQSIEVATVKESAQNEPPAVKQFHGSCDDILNNLIDKGFSQTTDYQTPLHIAIPIEKKSTNVDDVVTKRNQATSLTRHPKLRCKKHIILNAYSQDEELKNLNRAAVMKSPATDRPHSVSPSERPSSPKMPILSPQHQLPPVLASQCVNGPPPLRPTTEVTGEDDDELQCPSISGETVPPYIGADCLPNPSPNNVADLLKDRDVANQNNKTNSIDLDETKVCKIPNLSAFVETGVAPPIDLNPKNTWSSSQLNPRGFISWKLQNLQKEPEWNNKKTGRKLIPVANVAPILKEAIDDANKMNTTVSTFDSLEPSKLYKNEAVDLQAELAAFKTSLRMPAKLISKRAALDEKRTGIAVEFGASSSRFLHLENSGDSVKPQSTLPKTFSAEEITEESKENPISEVEGDKDQIKCDKDQIKCDKDQIKCDKDQIKCDSDRNIWNSLSVSTDTDSLLDNILHLSKSNSIKTSDIIPQQKTKYQAPKTAWRLSPRRFLFTRIAEKFRAKRRLVLSEDIFDRKSSGSKKKRHRRHRRSMLDEIANSDGFVAEQRLERDNSSKVDLFADPALLSREERALQKAMLRFTEMETGKFRKTPHQKRQSNTQRKAYQLKRKAMRSSPNSKGIHNGDRTSPGKKGFVDFQPEVLTSRTRTQTKGVHGVGGYNRDAAYEEELVKDDRRKQLKRARRRARKMGDRRSNARKLRREHNSPSLPERKDNSPKIDMSKDIAGSPRKSLKVLKGCITTDGNAIGNKVSTIPVIQFNGNKTLLSLDDLDELPDLVGKLTTYVTEDKDLPEIVSNLHLFTGPELRSDHSKERIHMKLSWRPVTAANKGKPRIATVRISHKQGQGANSVRMIKLRRHAKQTYQQTSQRQQTSNRRRRKRRREINHPPSNSSQCSDTLSPSTILRSKRPRNKKMKNTGSNILARLRRRLNQGSGMKSPGSRKANSRHHTSSSRYPLRDLATKKTDSESDGYTTEEYDIEDDQNYVHSSVDRYQGSRRAEVGYQGLPRRFPEPPDLPKLFVNRKIGETALHRAARLGYEEVVQYLLSTESEDVNSRDHAGYTALHEGCTGNHITIVANLLAHGSKPNVCSLDGVRPIQNAMENSNFDIIRLLLSYGADPLLDVSPNISGDILKFVENYTKDINGYPDGKEEASWRFYGSAVLDDQNGVEHNLFTNVPSDDEDETLEDMFECSQSKQFVSYRLKVPEAEREDNYVLLADILKHFEMTRGMFLQELGTRVRIYSLSRQTLQEEIEQASTVCPVLSNEIKELQTIEVIQLNDVQFVINHKLKLSNEKTTNSYQLKEISEAITGSSSLLKARHKSSEPDLVYPCGMAPRALSRAVSDLSAPEHFQLPKNNNRSPRTVRLSREAHSKPNKSKSTDKLNSPRRGRPPKTRISKDDNMCDNINNNCSIMTRNDSDVVNCKAIQDSKGSHCLKTRRTLSFLSYDEDKFTDICSDGIVQDIKNNNSRCATTTLCDDTNQSFIDR